MFWQNFHGYENLVNNQRLNYKKGNAIIRKGR